MGKVKSWRKAVGRRGDPIQKATPLATQITSEGRVRERVRAPREEEATGNEEEGVVSHRLTAKILEGARKQQEEVEEELGVARPAKTCIAASSRGITSNTSDDDDDDDDDDESDRDDDDYYEDIHLEEDEEKALERFMTPGQGRRCLADVIREKIEEKQTEQSVVSGGGGSVQELDPRVVEMYQGVRKVLARYRSGKLPKAFKIIPTLPNWEQLLHLTDPENWSAAAVYQATRIFASNLNPKMAQRFYNLVLLPRLRDDIDEYKRLNYHLYASLRKALFKPTAWFKGILLPLCESGTCTLRESLIVSSVLTKNTVPMLHSSAALLKLCEMEYTGANSIFLRVLLDKKYALPYRVVDGVVLHFLRFRSDRRELPVLWHQALLSFVQHYKQDISCEQREALFELCRSHRHHGITPEIQRELAHAKTRDIEDQVAMSDS